MSFQQLRLFLMIALGEDWAVYGNTAEESIRAFVAAYNISTVEDIRFELRRLLDEVEEEGAMEAMLTQLGCAYPYKKQGFSAKSFAASVYRTISELTPKSDCA